MRVLSAIRSWTGWEESGALMIPPRINVAVLWSAVTLPLSVALGVAGGQWVAVIWHSCLTVICVIHCQLQRRFYLHGVDDGREELVEEVLDAYYAHGVTPGEYLAREFYFAEYTSDARRQVRRAQASRKPNTR